MDHASGTEEAVVGWGHWLPVTKHWGKPREHFCYGCSAAVKDRRGTRQRTDFTTDHLHVFGTQFPIAAMTAGTDEITDVST